MPRRIDQIELVLFTILRGVLHAHGMCFDGDPALALQIHRVEHLLLHLAHHQRSREL